MDDRALDQLLRRPQAPDPFVIEQLARETAVRAARTPAQGADTAGSPPEVLDAVAAAVDDLAEELVAVSHDLHAHPEVAFEEHRSAEALAVVLEAHGLAVTRKAHGLDTALRAEVGAEVGVAGAGPTIAVMSEYDALPGVGHGCGHNIIATSALGAFLALARVHRERGLPGRVVWLGTPAEEGGGGKELMALDGALDGVDAAIMVHPFTYDVAEPVFLGRRQLRATYTGVASHASAQPFMGRNALDAVHLAYSGVALHRQQMPPTDRIHGVVTDGGERPNVIPERAEILFYLRSEHPEGLRVLSDRLGDIVHGAALMAGCGVELSWDEAPPYLPIRHSTPLAHAWTTRYGARGHDVLGPGVVPSLMAGSTDFGNVSFRVPGLHAMVKIGDDLSLHTHDFAAAAASATGDRVLVDSAHALAAVAADWLHDAGLREAAAAAFEAAGGAIDVPSYFEPAGDAR